MNAHLKWNFYKLVFLYIYMHKGLKQPTGKKKEKKVTLLTATFG